MREIVLLRCPACQSTMNYQRSLDSTRARSRKYKACVYCGKRFSVESHLAASRVSAGYSADRGADFVKKSQLDESSDDEWLYSHEVFEKSFCVLCNYLDDTIFSVILLFAKSEHMQNIYKCGSREAARWASISFTMTKKLIASSSSFLIICQKM